MGRVQNSSVGRQKNYRTQSSVSKGTQNLGLIFFPILLKISNVNGTYKVNLECIV